MKNNWSIKPYKPLKSQAPLDCVCVHVRMHVCVYVYARMHMCPYGGQGQALVSPSVTLCFVSETASSQNLKLADLSRLGLAKRPLGTSVSPALKSQAHMAVGRGLFGC